MITIIFETKPDIHHTNLFASNFFHICRTGYDDFNTTSSPANFLMSGFKSRAIFFFALILTQYPAPISSTVASSGKNRYKAPEFSVGTRYLCQIFCDTFLDTNHPCPPLVFPLFFILEILPRCKPYMNS